MLRSPALAVTLLAAGADEGFEARHPGIDIHLTNSPSNDHHAHLAIRLIGGNPLDIVHMTARFL